MDTSSSKDIKHLVKIVIDHNIVKSIYGRDSSYNDEPKIYSFVARLNLINVHKNTGSQFASASSFFKRDALIRCMGEAIERFGAADFSRYNFVWDNYDNLKKKAINPCSFVSFSNYRIKPYFITYKNDKQRMNWVEGHSLVRGKNILIPAQLVFIPYNFKTNEPVLRFPTTTGCASYHSLEGAILRGLLEVIERDAFAINYLNKLSRNIIDLSHSNDRTLRDIIDYIKRYNLDIYIIDISTDVPVYTIMTIIIDRTGNGPAVSVGAKSDFSLKKAIRGSIEECLHIRPWLRELMIKQGDKANRIVEHRKYIVTTEERGSLWISSKAVNKIKFFLQGKKIPVNRLPKNKCKDLSGLLKWFKKNKEDVLYVNLTPPSFKKDKVYVVRVLVPRFQPIYFDERFPYWMRERLREVPLKLGLKPLKNINKFPHPFL